MIERLRPSPPPPPPPKPRTVAAKPPPKREQRSSSFQAAKTKTTRRESKSTSFSAAGPQLTPAERMRAAKETSLSALAVHQARDTSKTASLDELRGATKDFKDAKKK